MREREGFTAGSWETAKKGMKFSPDCGILGDERKARREPMPRQEIERATEQLAQAIRESEEYVLYKGLKDAVMSNDTNRALLKEYQKAQTTLQMAAMAGKEADEDTVQRFSQLSSLLYMNNEVAQYLLAQLRVQKLAGDVFGSIAAAAGLEFELPGM